MRTDNNREEVIDQLWRRGIRDIFDIARVCSQEPSFSDFNPGSTVIFITHHLAYKQLKPTLRPPDERTMRQASGGQNKAKGERDERQTEPS